MSVCIRRLVVGLFVCVSISNAIAADSFRESLKFDEESTLAISRGTRFLFKEIAKTPSTFRDEFGIGQIAFETYALLVAGAAADHPLL
ncbi:MAG: hypothetical protein AAF517_14795, partial [Planctomycetota bacterium]